MRDMERQEAAVQNLLNEAYTDGVNDAIEAYRTILNHRRYDAVAVFGRGDVASMLDDMTPQQIIDGAQRVNEWIEDSKGQYSIGQTVLDPLGKLCMITNINTGRSADILGGYDVIYPSGVTNRWPIGAALEGVTDSDNDILTNLLYALRNQEEIINADD